jgi:hypothetical protein
VKTVIHGDDFESAAAVFRAPFAGQFDGALVGLGAAVGEEHLVQPTVMREQRRKLDHAIVVERRAAIDQPFRLPRQSLQDRPRRMAERVDGPALNEIEVAAAFGVDQPRTLPRGEHHRWPGCDIHYRVDGFGLGCTGHHVLLGCEMERQRP